MRSAISIFHVKHIIERAGLKKDPPPLAPKECILSTQQIITTYIIPPEETHNCAIRLLTRNTILFLMFSLSSFYLSFMVQVCHMISPHVETKQLFYLPLNISYKEWALGCLMSGIPVMQCDAENAKCQV